MQGRMYPSERDVMSTSIFGLCNLPSRCSTRAAMGACPAFSTFRAGESTGVLLMRTSSTSCEEVRPHPYSVPSQECAVGSCSAESNGIL
jgi:hypothetical protein